MREVKEVVRGDVDRAHDPLAVLAEIEHVDAGRRLLEVPEEHPLAREREGEDRAVDAAVEDGERRVPVVVCDEALERGEDAIEELADRLAAQEPRLVRDDAAEGVDELVLERVGRDLREATAAELA